MKRYELQKGEIERIGRRLIGSNTISEAEIDQIIAKPFLYSAVRAKLADEAATPRFGNRRRFVAAFASLAIVTIVTASVLVSRNAEPNQTATTDETVAPVPVQKFTEPDRLNVEKVTTHAAVLPEPRRTVSTAQNVSYRKPASDNFKGRKAVKETQPDLEFYPLTYAGDPGEAVRGGRIIRVEMSRASLFAMGVNLPIENGAELVKADILFGPDGVPRAIRMPN